MYIGAFVNCNEQFGKYVIFKGDISPHHIHIIEFDGVYHASRERYGPDILCRLFSLSGDRSYMSVRILGGSPFVAMLHHALQILSSVSSNIQC